MPAPDVPFDLHRLIYGWIERSNRRRLDWEAARVLKAAVYRGEPEGVSMDQERAEQGQGQEQQAPGPWPVQGNAEWLEQVFERSYQPGEGQLIATRAVRGAAREFVEIICSFVPVCADRSAAIRKVREALWSACDAIRLRGLV